MIRYLPVSISLTLAMAFAHTAVADTASPPATDEAHALAYDGWRSKQAVNDRLGVDAYASVGWVATLGGQVRYEHRVTDDGGFVVMRGQLLTGGVPDGEGDGFTAVFGYIGYRAYWGGFYAGAELGFGAVHDHTTPEDVKTVPMHTSWDPIPNASLGIGGKAGPVDIGLSASLTGLQLSLGFDFVAM